jgi:hypothetical protein
LKQQQPSDSNLAFFMAHASHCCVVVGGRVFEHLLFSEWFSGFAYFQP